MEQVKISCCLCGNQTFYNQSRMCINCLQIRAVITDTIPKEFPLQICRYCEKYNRPPWLSANLESPELLSICLTRIKALHNLKVVDSGFIWTEPHSKRLIVRVRIQKEVENAMIEQECLIKFIIQDTQCDECKKSFTPHTWTAKVQIRQKVPHMRTLHHFEQLIIRNNANKEFLEVKQKKHGFDIHFNEKQPAKKFIDFVHAHIPAQVKFSQELISSDLKSNIYNYKFTYVAEVIPICKGDLIILPPNIKISGLGRLLLCTKVTTQVHVVDVITFQSSELKALAYWKNPFPVYASKERLIEFIILDIEKSKDGRFDLEVTRANAEPFGEITHRIWSHFGDNLACGDMVLGYDMMAMVDHQIEHKVLQNIPDVIIVNKVRQQRKIGKRLEGIAGEVSASDSDEIIGDAEEEIAEGSQSKNKKPRGKGNKEGEEEGSKHITGEGRNELQGEVIEEQVVENVKDEEELEDKLIGVKNDEDGKEAKSEN